MFCSRPWRSIGLCMAGVLCVAALADGATRVAVLISSKDDAAANIAALAEAELSSDAAFTVLERQRIDQLLSEQKLSLSGLVDTDQAVRAGKVLGCQMLVILEPEPGSSQFGLVIFDPVTGVRLQDLAMSETATDKAAGAVIGAVRAADRKRGGGNGRTVCLLAVRNADLPRDMDGFCDAVGRLVEQNLVGSPVISLLERQRLDRVTRERALAADAASQQLLASLVIVDLQIERNPQGVRATALLSDVAGNNLGKVASVAPATAAPLLASSLADELARNLKLPAVPQLDVRAEAARFYSEFQFHTQNQDFLRALSPVEAAHALAPDDVIFGAALAQALIAHGRTLYRGPNYSPHSSSQPWERHDLVPPSLLRGAAMLAEVQPKVIALAPKARDPARQHCLNALAGLRDFVADATWFQTDGTDRTPLPSPEVASVKRSLRQYLLEEDAELIVAITDEASFKHYSAHLVQLLSDNQWLYSVNSGQWTDDFRRLADQWLELRAKYRSTDSDEVASALDAIAVGWQFEEHLGTSFYGGEINRRTRRWDPDSAGIARLNAIQQKLAADPDQVVRWYGDLMTLSIDVTPLFRSPQRIYERVQEFIDKMKPELADPGFSATLEKRGALYQVLIQADRLLDATEWRGKCAMRLLELSLSRHEIVPRIIDRSMRRFRFGATATDDQEYKARSQAIYRRALEVLDAPDCTVFGIRGKENTRAAYRLAMKRLQNPLQPLVAQPTTQPWYRVRPLLDVINATTGVRAIGKPVLDGEYVDVAGSQPMSDRVSAARIQFIRVPLTGGPPQRLGMLPTHDVLDWSTTIWPDGTTERLLDGTPASASCVGDGRYCVATGRDGILFFPTDGHFPQQLNEQNGLPDNHAHAVALLNGRLFAALGTEETENYLIGYDTTSRRIEVIASTARKEKRSPFDDRSGLRIVGLTPDPPRNRLIVTIAGPGATAQLSGLWEFRPATGRWQYLQPVHLFREQNELRTGGAGRNISQVSSAFKDVFCFFAGEQLFAFDLVQNRAFAFGPLDGANPTLPPQTPMFGALTSVGSQSLLRARFARLNDSSFVNGPWVWGEWGRTNIATGQTQRFATLRIGGPPNKVNNVQPIGDGSSVLVNDYMGLWVVEPFE